jgi:hypothetical protein
MNEQLLNQKTQLDLTRVKKEVNSLNKDIFNKVNKISIESNHSMDFLAAWVNIGLSKLSSELEKVKEDSKKTVTHASTTTKKIVGAGLSHYNAKASEVVIFLPSWVGVKAGEYPWVSISFALLAGFLMRGFLMSRWNQQES